jgi:hypothetical protein
MVERQLILVLSSCLAVAGTLALAAWCAWEPPDRVDIRELEGMEVGRLVTVEGTVVSTPVTGGEVSVVVLGDGTGGTVPLFMTFPSDTVPVGSRLRATGRVAIHDGVTEVVVSGRDDLRILSRPSSPQVDLVELMEGPWAFDGMRPTVSVTLLVDPVADLNGEDWWSLVVGPEPVGGPSALVLFGPGTTVDGLRSGDQLDLRVAVRYDATSGFVYLEVLEVL